MSSPQFTFLDCTLRDGGYYNNWNFSSDLIAKYLSAAELAGVDVVELGFRFIDTEGFKGACAFSTDDFLDGLGVSPTLTVSVMLNASDLFRSGTLISTLERLFPRRAADSRVDLVRIACHAREYLATLPAADWLAERGYRVGLNVMQITDRTREEVIELAEATRAHPVEVFYFADSMGSMTPEQTRQIIGWIREVWDGPIGVHTHDNMGLALANTLAAIEAGATWLDATVTGMGRGPGNARTEELMLELAALRPERIASPSAMIDLVAKDFGPMKARYGWGTNPLYYLSGKYGIHPTYVQTMLSDARFSTDDILSVIEMLRAIGGKKFNRETLFGARKNSGQEAGGDWSPRGLFEGREVLILGSGASVIEHRAAVEGFIRRNKPLVVGLNALTNIDDALIDLRIACHPLRLLADASTHARQSQPLVAPLVSLAPEVRQVLNGKTLYNFGLSIGDHAFSVEEHNCILPGRLVAAYALAIATAGKARRVYLVGFDGFPLDDPRYHEMRDIFDACQAHPDLPEMVSLTETNYATIPMHSIYGLMR